MGSVKEVGAKLYKWVGAKSSLIKWSQDWSLDPWGQVVQEVAKVANILEPLLQIDCTVAKWENILKDSIEQWRVL